MGYTILEENSRTVLVRMPKSYIAKLDSLSSHSRKRTTSADQMTPQELTQYHIAKKDLENGVNIMTGSDFIRKFNLK